MRFFILKYIAKHRKSIDLIVLFFRLNAVKLLIWTGAYISFYKGVYEIEKKNPFPLFFLIFLHFALISAVYKTIKRGYTRLKIIDQLANDTESWYSIIPLFDDKFTFKVIDRFTLKKYTGLCMCGNISGLPAMVSFELDKGNTFGYLDYVFEPLAYANTGKYASKSIWFDMSGDKLHKNVKPEVRQFVEELKQEGYSPLEQ